jgi:acetylornithine deacetylase/succinyl-diaminopimelate desuccinylase-like protein
VIVGMAANDCRHQVNKGKMPAAVFGPGTGNQAHTIDESIRIGDLLGNVKALAAAICDWCG